MCVDRIVVVSLVLHRTRYFVDVLWVARCKTDKPLTILIFLQKSKKARPAAVEENRKPSERVGAYVFVHVTVFWQVCVSNFTTTVSV